MPISSKVLVCAFSLSAEIEQSLISARTKEGLAQRKAEGKKLGRPPGSRSRISKLAGKEADIERLLMAGVSPQHAHAHPGRRAGMPRGPRIFGTVGWHESARDREKPERYAGSISSTAQQ